MPRKYPRSSQPKLTHLDQRGAARMVDVGAKAVEARTAIAEALLRAAPTTVDAILEGGLPKGDAAAVARLAGILAAKRCDELIPLCHSLAIEHASIEFARAGPGAVRVTATVSTTARTGVEMEAITAALIAAAALYDMAKAIDKDMSIDGARLVSKTKTDPLTPTSRRAGRPRRTRG